jgi:hypothetical protein
MRFDFRSGGLYSGGLAFFTPSTGDSGAVAGGSLPAGARPLLMVTDHAEETVHLVDVVARTHAGHLVPPGSIPNLKPRGVAASASSPLVAVSTWKGVTHSEHTVQVYRDYGGVGLDWELVQVLGAGFGVPGSRDGQLALPHGLRFSRDGTAICVAELANRRVSLFRVGDGSFVRHVVMGQGRPNDVEEVEGGWLVACTGSNSVEFIGGGEDAGRRATLGTSRDGSRDGKLCGPSALAVVPGLGLVVRERDGGRHGRVHVFASPDDVAMATMSPVRVAWMVIVVKGCRWRHKAPCVAVAEA